MGLICKGFIGLVLGMIFYVVYHVHVLLYTIPETPVYSEIWWGTGDPSNEDTIIKPFKIDVSKEILDDLKYRLDNAIPIQEPLEGVNQHYGMNGNLLKNIVEYWKNDYNWTERQQFLNQYTQYRVRIQGLKIHYIHVKPKVTKNSNIKVLPLLLLHGWPGSVREFYEIIPLLTQPQRGRKVVFEVIVPSLPGFGFSEAAKKPGMTAIRMAQIFKNLMAKLGHKKFYIQGGDWGSVIMKYMSIMYPENILGAHSNFCLCNRIICHVKTFILGTTFPSLLATDEELPFFTPLVKLLQDVFMLELGYFHIQSTKPDTVGAGLRDSPIGLAAYILEKFTTYTNPEWKNLEDGGLTRKFTMDQLLDNVMIYWITRSMTTSQRIYAENFNKEMATSELNQIPSKVPAACAQFKYEIAFQPETLIRDEWPNLIQINRYEDGGHFAAFEMPSVFAEDVYNFVEKTV